jgi:hypothetical protein
LLIRCCRYSPYPGPSALSVAPHPQSSYSGSSLHISTDACRNPSGQRTVLSLLIPLFYENTKWDVAENDSSHGLFQESDGEADGRPHPKPSGCWFFRHERAKLSLFPTNRPNFFYGRDLRDRLARIIICLRNPKNPRSLNRKKPK